MQDINAWLQGNQDYNTGLALYSKYGQSEFLKNLFANGPTPFNKSKLAAELLKLAPTPPANEIAVIPNTELLELSESKTEFSESDLKQKAENHKIYLAFQEDNKTKYRQLERNMAMLDYSNE